MMLSYLPKDVMDIIMRERRNMMLRDKYKTIFDLIISTEQIEDGSLDYWIDWNYVNGENWDGGFDH